MKVIKITGKKELNGEIFIKGSKNASLALLVVSLLSKDKVILKNVPNIQDILDLIEILKTLNVEITKIEDGYIVDSRNIINMSLTSSLVKHLRASYYFMGCLLALFGKCKILGPGGCNLGKRPIDMHLDFFEKTGVNVIVIDDVYYLEAKRLKGCTYEFRQKSVGATINALLIATSIEEKVVLKNVSIEPEVLQVIEAINLMGIDIKLEEDVITIKGRKIKHGFMINVIPDRIEAGTYALIGASCAKKLVIHNFIIGHNMYLIDLFDKSNVKYELSNNNLIVYKSLNLKPVVIETLPYPYFPTDLQQPLTSFLTLANGTSVIKENIYCNRMSHINELNKMGANIKQINNEIIINGPINLKGSILNGYDLRGGASLILAAMIANNESTIKGLKYIQRGYTNIVDNLASLGADIYVDEE